MRSDRVSARDSVTSRRDSEKNGPLARTDDMANGCEPDPSVAAAVPREGPELASVHALADGALTHLEAARVRRHLGRCAPCRSELAFLMQLAMAVARGVLALEGIEGIEGIEAPEIHGPA